MSVAIEAEALVQELEQWKDDLQEKLHPASAPTGAKQFVADLQAMKEKAARQIRQGKLGKFHFGDVTLPPEQRRQVTTMLKLLVYPETRVGDQVARRLVQLPDLDLKARASQQVIDEIGHAQVLREMLERWGEDARELEQKPLPEIEAVFDYVEELETPVEYFTANFMCEGLFLPSHLHAMAELDPRAFQEYIDATLGDEAQHIALARDVILRYATTAEIQQRCREVARKVTSLFLQGFVAKVQSLMEDDLPHKTLSSANN
jgi:hypothetical protein